MAEQLSVSDLIKAPTCRGFQETLGERVQASINRCVEEANARWGSDSYGVDLLAMASLGLFGLHPLTLQRIGEQGARVALSLQAEDQVGMVSVPAGALPPSYFVVEKSDGLIAAGGIPFFFHSNVEVTLDSVHCDWCL